MQNNEYLIGLLKEFIKLNKALKIVEKKLIDANIPEVMSILIGNSEHKVDAIKEFEFLIDNLENNQRSQCKLPEEIEIEIKSSEKQLKRCLEKMQYYYQNSMT